MKRPFPSGRRCRVVFLVNSSLARSLPSVVRGCKSFRHDRATNCFCDVYRVETVASSCDLNIPAQSAREFIIRNVITSRVSVKRGRLSRPARAGRNSTRLKR